VNAAFWMGKTEALVEFAANAEGPTSARVEALAVLREWEHPSGRDRLMGLWRPIPERDPAEAAKVLSSRLADLLRSSEGEVVVETARLAGALKLEGTAALLKKSFENRETPGPARAALLRAISELRPSGFAHLVSEALEDPDDAVAGEAMKSWAGMKVPGSPEVMIDVVRGKRSSRVRQAALQGLAVVGSDADLGALLDRGVAPELQLELFEAASSRPSLKDKAAKLQPSLLEGGDAAAGRRIFFERGDVQCLRCHTIGDQGGQVGPALTKIAEQKTREYLLESILTPNKQIAEGWGQTSFQLQNEAVEVGRIEKESESTVTLILPDGQRKAIAKADIKARKAALSSMPEDIAKSLSKRDLRDLVEFLAGLK